MLICGGVTPLECACSRGKPETARKVVPVSHHGDKRCPELQPENLVYPPRTRSDHSQPPVGHAIIVGGHLVTRFMTHAASSDLLARQVGSLPCHSESIRVRRVVMGYNT